MHAVCEKRRREDRMLPEEAPERPSELSLS